MSLWNARGGGRFPAEGMHDRRARRESSRVAMWTMRRCGRCGDAGGDGTAEVRWRCDGVRGRLREHCAGFDCLPFLPSRERPSRLHWLSLFGPPPRRATSLVMSSPRPWQSDARTVWPSAAAAAAAVPADSPRTNLYVRTNGCVYAADACMLCVCIAMSESVITD